MIYKIPVIGHLIGVIVRLIKLPEHIRAIDVSIQNNEATIKALSEYVRTLELRMEELYQENETLYQKNQEEHLRLEEGYKSAFDEGFNRLLSNGKQLELLNLQLSIHQTVWGDESRLHISPLAAVFTCFFNTNSGEITVGDYTFAGSNVSVLAGSHDMFLEGLSRRDAEIKQGCDIVIGKGVWLGSGCTILGPCSIGDSAVVAAGAVVTPGTVIPPGTVYAGVPAKLIRTIEVESQMSSQHIVDAVNRENGVLFVDGWSEKRQIVYNNTLVQGHWLVKNEARMYTNVKVVKTHFHKNTDELVRIIWQQGSKQREILLETNDMEYELVIDSDDNVLQEVKIYVDECMQNHVFVAVIES